MFLAIFMELFVLQTLATVDPVASIPIISDCPVNQLETYIETEFRDKEGVGDIVLLLNKDVDIASPHLPITTLSEQLLLSSWILTPLSNVVLIFFPIPQPSTLIELQHFIYNNFDRIQTVIIWWQLPRKSKEFMETTKWAKKIHKDFVMVENFGNNISYFKNGLDSCGTDLKCALAGQHVRVGCSHSRPYFGFKNASINFENNRDSVIAVTPGNLELVREEFYGLEAELLKIMVEIYGLSFTLVPTIYGRTYNDGAFTGKFSLLERREVDMVVGCISGNYIRNLLGTYSPQVCMIRFTLVSTRAGPLPKYHAPLRPLPWNAWVILFLSLAVVGPLAWWITKVHSKIVPGSEAFTASVSSFTGHVALTLVIEPWHNSPRGPISFILTGWFLACLILQCLYSSNLVASFSVPEFRRQVNTFADAKRLGKTVLIKEGTTVNVFLDESSPEASFKVVITDDGYRLHAINGDTVMASNAEYFKFKALAEGRDPDDYHISKKSFLNVFAGWLYSKDFKFKNAFNAAILRVTDAGLVDKWTEDFGYGTHQLRLRQLGSKKELQKNVLGMDHLVALFFFWIVGIVASSLVLCAEIAYHFMFKAEKIINAPLPLYFKANKRRKFKQPTRENFGILR